MAAASKKHVNPSDTWTYNVKSTQEFYSIIKQFLQFASKKTNSSWTVNDVFRLFIANILVPAVKQKEAGNPEAFNKLVLDLYLPSDIKAQLGEGEDE